MSALSPTSSTNASAAMRWSAVCCLLLAVYVSTCMEAPVRVERLDQRKNAPQRQICPGCEKTVSRGYVKRHRCPQDGFVDYRKRQKVASTAGYSQGVPPPERKFSYVNIRLWEFPLSFPNPLRKLVGTSWNPDIFSINYSATAEFPISTIQELGTIVL